MIRDRDRTMTILDQLREAIGLQGGWVHISPRTLLRIQREETAVGNYTEAGVTAPYNLYVDPTVAEGVAIHLLPGDLIGQTIILEET